MILAFVRRQSIDVPSMHLLSVRYHCPPPDVCMRPTFDTISCSHLGLHAGTVVRGLKPRDWQRSDNVCSEIKPRTMLPMLCYYLS